LLHRAILTPEPLVHPLFWHFKHQNFSLGLSCHLYPCSQYSLKLKKVSNLRSASSGMARSSAATTAQATNTSAARSCTIAAGWLGCR